MAMVDTLEEKIQQRAYEVWEREGRPNGKQDEHWTRACRRNFLEVHDDFPRSYF
jgi:hypothetical protein